MTKLLRRVRQIVSNLFLVYGAFAVLGGIVFIYVCALYTYPLLTLLASSTFVLGIFTRNILHFFAAHAHVNRVIGLIIPH